MVGDNKESLKGKGVFFGSSVGGWWFVVGLGVGGGLSSLPEVSPWRCIEGGVRESVFGLAPSIRALALLREG